MTTTYQITFTAVQQMSGNVDGVQLSRIELYDAEGTELVVEEATNAAGSSPKSQQPPKLLDGLTNTKWYDGNFAPLGTSTLTLRLSGEATATSHAHLWALRRRTGASRCSEASGATRATTFGCSATSV